MKNRGREINMEPIRAGTCSTPGRENEHYEIDPGKRYAKKTFLYLLVLGHMSEMADIQIFLQKRFRKHIDFEITKVMKHQEAKQVVINTVFSSRRRAKYAKRLLKQSNARSLIKIVCYISYINSYDMMIDKIKESIYKQAENALEKHSIKLIETKQQIEIRQTSPGSARSLSLDTNDKNINEKKVREDLLQQLKLQKENFEKYLQSIKVKLEKNEDFDAGVLNIRKDVWIECQRLNKALPIYANREKILTTVRSHQVFVLLGETGSGKSTQLVQYLHQAGFAVNGSIACTQPRKIAAISLATHVAREMASSVGQEVGYKVGMQSKKKSLTKVLYMTDHVLLNDCLQDPNFSAYSCVIIDEAHERSIYTDLLLGMLKKCLSSRKDLKVIITSATINPDVFVQYFGGREVCPILKVSGRTFPVDIFWDLDDPYDAPFPEEYEDKAVKKAVEIHRSSPIKEGDILVFLTSPAETEKCSRRFQQIAASDDYECLLLHGKLDATEQKKVFEKSPGRRKIVFATNSAETYITIPGIKFVVDTGVVKEMWYDQKKNMNSLDIRPISQSSAEQRKGRAGRTASGICYRLYSENNFAAMDKGSMPEILRVNLGESVLKLLELGVDVKSFDFVESPGNDALSEAFKLLNNVKAIKDGHITEFGKWLAKLPVEPRLGLLIKLGIDANVPLEAAIVAASSNQSSVFYRGGSQEQKTISDLNKIPFSHSGGDLLTILEVYRSWDKLPEKQKAPWCFLNSINSKAINGIRETVKETLWTLDREHGIKIKYQLKPKEHADGIIQKIIFQCMNSNLSMFLGHESAGYWVVDRGLHVKIHPSSSLFSLALQPKWVVYSQLVRTSQDFITNVTPISEEDVKEANDNKKIVLEMSWLDKLQLKLACKKLVGKHVLWKFVGPQHKNRRLVEEEISQNCDNSLVVIEADEIRSEISVYCREAYQQTAAKIVLAKIAEAGRDLLNETLEDCIGNSGCDVRVVLSSGGMVVDVLMPNEYRKCNILGKVPSKSKLTEDIVKNAVSKFGIIEELWKSNNLVKGDFLWGKVTFVSYKDAKRAVTEINDDVTASFTLEPIISPTFGTRNRGSFKLRLHWCRRKNKGLCFVRLKNHEDHAPLLGRSVNINGVLGSAKNPMYNKDKFHLLIEPLNPEVKEEEVKQALANLLGVNLQINPTRFEVSIPRKDALYMPQDKNVVQQTLSSKLLQYCESGSFEIFLRDYKDQTAFCSADATFSDLNECEKAANGLIQNGDVIFDSQIHVEKIPLCTIFLPKYVYAVSKRDIDKFLSIWEQKESTTSVSLRPLKTEHFSIDIKASSIERLAHVKLAVDKLIAGKTIDCSVLENGQWIFTESASRKLKTISKHTNTIVVADERQNKVTVQGLTENVDDAATQILIYMKSFARVMVKHFPLKGEGSPTGFMKKLLVKYGISLQKLREQYNLVDVNLNLKLHELTLIGDEDSLTRATDDIENERKDITEKARESVSEYDLPECPVCMSPVVLGDMFILGQCGHAYCNACLTSLLLSSVTSKKFPILCCSDGCGEPLLIRDLILQFKIGSVSRRELVGASLDCFISKNKNDFSHCITPDCQMVYRVTSSGERFNCRLCMTSICTRCRVRYHDGFSCSAYQLVSKDDSLAAWFKEKPDERKLCPNCNVGIEKREGCDHMQCTQCSVHICWKCLKYFDNSQMCYRHLAEEHGSFV